MAICLPTGSIALPKSLTLSHITRKRRRFANQLLAPRLIGPSLFGKLLGSAASGLKTWAHRHFLEDIWDI